MARKVGIGYYNSRTAHLNGSREFKEAVAKRRAKDIAELKRLQEEINNKK